MEHLNQMETKSVWKLLLSFSIPTIIASTVHALYNIVDRIYIGKALGTDALAGVTITFPIFILSIALGVLLGTGSSAIISIRLGEKRRDDAEKTLGNTFGLFGIVGILVSIVALTFLEPLLRLVGADSITMPYAAKYMTLFLPFMMFDFLAMGTNGCIRAEGNPRLAMVIAASGALMNIILDPLFLFVFHWGVSGIALATGLSRLFTACWVFWHFRLGKSRHLTVHYPDLKPVWKIVKPVIIIGFAPFSMMLATAMVSVLLNRLLVDHGGVLAVGALGAIQSIFMIVETPLRSIMMAGQPIIGYNFGAGLHKRVIESVKVSFVYSLVISISGFAFIMIFPELLISMFSKGDAELISIGSTGLKIFLSMLPFIGLHMMATMYYQAVNKPKEAILLNMLRKVIFFLPALFILPRFFQLNGVWMATPVADLLACIIAMFMIRKSLNSCAEMVRKKEALNSS